MRREDLYREVWGGRLRSGDRSIDVYVHKLRVKLEEACRARAGSTRTSGFGYRFDPEPFTPFSHHGHGSATG